MDLNVLKSYLVDLGFAVNEPQLRKFDQALQQAAGRVEAVTTGMLSTVVKWQAAVTSAFTGVSTAVIGLADHVAQADQEYRLFGLRMMMSTDQARKLKIGMDALGASMEEIAWDPELHKRFLELNQLQDGLAAKLGGSYEQNMRGIRDMRFEFTKIRVEMQYLSMVAVSALYTKLKPFIEQIQAKLEQFVGWFLQHLPEISDWISDNLVPVLKDTWDILKDTGEVVGIVATAFTNLIGLLSGDSSIQGTEFNFHKLSGAIQHVTHWVSTFMHAMLNAEKVLAHFANAAVLTLSGRFADAKKELGAALNTLGPGEGALIGGAGGWAAGGMAGAAYGTALGSVGGPIGMAVGALGGGTVGSIIGGLTGAGVGAGAGVLSEHMRPTQQGGDVAHIRDLALEAGKALGMNPRLIFEQWQHESGGFNSNVFRAHNNMGGIRLPGTTQYQTFDSLDDYAKRYVEVLKLKRYDLNGVQDENQFAHQLKKGGYYEDTESNYANALNRWSRQDAGMFQQAAPSSSTTIEVGDVNVHVAGTNASAEEIGAQVKNELLDLSNKQRARNLAQLGYVGG